MTVEKTNLYTINKKSLLLNKIKQAQLFKGKNILLKKRVGLAHVGVYCPFPLRTANMVAGIGKYGHALPFIIQSNTTATMVVVQVGVYYIGNILGFIA